MLFHPALPHINGICRHIMDDYGNGLGTEAGHIITEQAIVLFVERRKVFTEVVHDAVHVFVDHGFKAITGFIISPKTLNNLENLLVSLLFGDSVPALDIVILIESGQQVEVMLVNASELLLKIRDFLF